MKDYPMRWLRSLLLAMTVASISACIMDDGVGGADDLDPEDQGWEQPRDKEIEDPAQREL